MSSFTWEPTLWLNSEVEITKLRHSCQSGSDETAWMDWGTHREVRSCGLAIALHWAAVGILHHTQNTEQFEVRF